MQQYKCHEHGVLDFAFSFDSLFLISASDEETVSQWDVLMGSLIKTLHGHGHYAHSNPISVIGFNGDGSRIISRRYGGLCWLWGVSTCHCMKTLIYDEEIPPVSYVKFSPNSKMILVGALDDYLAIFHFNYSIVDMT
ncbi:hypothetical protein RYX36_002172 [Vicia faba]